MNRDSARRMLSNAHYARTVSVVLSTASKEMAALAEGMWNPSFCSADAQDESIEDFFRIIQSQSQHLMRVRAQAKQRLASEEP